MYKGENKKVGEKMPRVSRFYITFLYL